MSFFRTLWRTLLVIVTFVFSALELAVERPKTRQERAAWLTKFASRLARRMDITFTTHGPVPTSGAVISNHVSFIDIILHAAIRPCVFVAKAELRKQPLLGWMSLMSGTVYVVRGGGGSAAAAAEGMARGFRDGLPVVFFPEGTTGQGDEPTLPFRTGLIAQTIEAEAPMTAAFISYSLSARDLAEGRTLRQDIYWGPQPFTSMIWAFCSLHGLHANFEFADAPIQFSEAALTNRKIAGPEAQAAVVRLANAPSAWTAPAS